MRCSVQPRAPGHRDPCRRRARSQPLIQTRELLSDTLKATNRPIDVILGHRAQEKDHLCVPCGARRAQRGVKRRVREHGTAARRRWRGDIVPSSVGDDTHPMLGDASAYGTQSTLTRLLQSYAARERRRVVAGQAAVDADERASGLAARAAGSSGAERALDRAMGVLRRRLRM
ncbi:hypothetical protein PsYK624_122120 [Phanerochaete sordida]|uniref:Uncharacterized protein n=1 Tax=Phanerochaete sordida TaxID=48140 RepID=A0A9P3GM82_9APHY|nr:hypothetical protein PsYK624_122120 [Phanerochaete sordida]